ncbi:MAG: bioH protein [Betaproteobacteria bacterium]|nr:bioH protein [Betaproteobacteria bacterium]
MRIMVEGAGPDLVLLPGWGMNAGVWGEFAAMLAREFRVHRVDLFAGHIVKSGDLDAVVEAVANACVSRATVCGWSLGGQVALRWAQLKPDQIQRVILIAATPRFVRKDNWDCGMEPAVFNAFARDFGQDIDAALQRFVLLQVHGDTKARDVARYLRAHACTAAASDVTALAGGLAILQKSDLRAELPTITQSMLILHGEHDGIVSPAAGDYLQRRLPHARLETIAGAAHAPFIAQPDNCARLVAAFCHG